MKLIDKAKKKFSAKKMRVECIYGPPSMLMGKDDRTGKQNYRPERDIIEGIYGPPTGYDTAVTDRLNGSQGDMDCLGRSDRLSSDMDNNGTKDKKEDDSY